MKPGLKSFLNIIFALLIAGGVFITGFFVAGHFNFEQKHYKVDSTWVYGVGTITLNSESKTRSKMSYAFNGANYNGPSYYSVTISGCVPGEKYIIKINPKDPEKYVPIDWRPLFDSSEATGITIGKITRFWRKHALAMADNSSDFTIFYSYAVAGKQYERQQVLPPDFSIKHPGLDKGQTFQVKYWNENNYRAILYLDKPASQMQP